MSGFDFDAVLRLWASKRLGVPIHEVSAVEAESEGLCGFGTCEYNETTVGVTLTDGRRFSGSATFGLWVRDIAEMDLSPEGDEGRSHGSSFTDIELVQVVS